MIIYILKSALEDEREEWENGLGINESMLWVDRGVMQSTNFNEWSDIQLEICPV